MKYFKIITLLFFFINTNLYSQDACDVPTEFGIYPFGFPHVANVIGDSGFALNFSYPGIWSYIGQMNLYYTNSNGDSFLFGVGLPYLMMGINKKINYVPNNGFLYLNLNFVYSENFSGSIGASNVFILSNNNFFEVDFDMFYFGGINGDMIIPSIPKSYGGIFNFSYIFSTKHFNFTVFAGISITKFYSSEVEKYYDGWMPGYSCSERIEPIWTNSYFNIPIGGSITLKF